MGKPAARMGDTAMTCNDPTDMPVGTVIGTAVTVLINNMPAAKQNDQVVGVDVHIVMVPTPGGPVPTPLPHPFMGMLDSGLSSSVKIEGLPAATVDSQASNTPPHIPTPPGTAFQKPPTNKAKIIIGSPNVLIGNGGGGGGGGGGQAGGGQSEGTSDEAAVEEQHYLDVNFVDGGGRPITGARYSVTSPDGETSEGALAGRIRQSGVQEGSYEVSVRAVTSATWSATTARVGEAVTLQAGISGFESGTAAVFQIFKKNASAADELVDAVEAESSGDNVEAEWTFRYRGRTGDPTLGRSRTQSYAFPRFYFIVDVGSCRARSGMLQISDSLKIVLKDENGNPIASEAYIVRFANGEVRRGTLDSNGEAIEANIPPEQSRVEFPNLSGARRLPR